MKTQNSKTVDTSLMAACLLIHLLAMLTMSAYQASGVFFSYTDRVAWSALRTGLSKLDLASIHQAVGFRDWLLLSFIVAGVLLASGRKAGPRSTTFLTFFILQPVIFYNGLVGIVLMLAFPFEIFGVDGEWFAENSPSLISTGVWMTASLFIAMRSLRDVRPVFFKRSPQTSLVGAFGRARRLIWS